MAKPVRKFFVIAAWSAVALLVLTGQDCPAGSGSSSTSDSSAFFPKDVPDLEKSPPADAPALAKSGTHVFIWPKSGSVGVGELVTFSIWVDSDRAISGGEVRITMPFNDFSAVQCGNNPDLAAGGGDLFGNDPTSESDSPDFVDGKNTKTVPAVFTPDRAIGRSAWQEISVPVTKDYSRTQDQLVIAEARRGTTPPSDGKVTRHWFAAFRIKVSDPGVCYFVCGDGEHYRKQTREGIHSQLSFNGKDMKVEVHLVYLDEKGNLQEIPIDSVDGATLG